MSGGLGPTKEFRPWEHAGPRLDDDAYYGIAGDIVRAIDPYTEADPSGMLVTVLTSFGCAVGSGPHMKVQGAAKHPARLFALLVGQSSLSRKGGSWSQASRFLAESDPHWYGERIMGGLSSGEGLISAVRDGSGEGDRGVDDKRLFVYEPELGGPLSVAAREGNTLSPTIRQAWDDGRLRVMTRRDPLRATGAHICILGHITRDELLHRLTLREARNGFANRFLFCLVHRSKLLPDGGGPPGDTVSTLAMRFGGALKAARRVQEMHRSPDAKELWNDLYYRMNDEELRPKGIVSELTARNAAHVLRLSVVYALLDGSAEVAVPHLLAAWSVWGYCEASVAAIWLGDSTTGDALTDRVYEVVKVAGGGGLSREEIRRDLSGHISAKELEDAIKRLVDGGLVLEEQLATGGRPKTVIQVIGAANGRRGGSS